MDGYGSSGIGARFNWAADWLTGADAERVEGALDRPGPGITPQALTTFARQARKGIRAQGGGAAGFGGPSSVPKWRSQQDSNLQPTE